MNRKKRLTKKQIAAHEALEKRVEREGVVIGKSDGKERFKAVLRRAGKKK